MKIFQKEVYHLSLILCLSIIFSSTGVYATDFQLTNEEDYDNTGDERLIILTSGTGLNTSQVLGFLLLLSSTLFPLLGIIALGILLFSILGTGVGGFAHSGYGSYSSYASSSYRSLNSKLDQWEALSVLDWISLAHDVYSQYSPSNLDCQQRVICEVYQNTDAFGPPAKNFIHYFEYLRYAEVLSIPEEVKDVIRELLGAADKGGRASRDCKEYFGSCNFSLKDAVQRYGIHNTGHSGTAPHVNEIQQDKNNKYG